MTDALHLNHYSDTPIFTIKTVVQETGISPATLRAWERRYGCLSPGRSDGGYRLYSERDVAVLRWLKRQVDAGIAISRAVALLEMRQNGSEGTGLALGTSAVELNHPAQGVRAAPRMVNDLVEALLNYDEGQAEAILGEAFALYAVEDVAEEVIAPTLMEIGERWHRGETSIVQEHFATAFLRRRLATLLQVYSQPATGPLAVTGSGPSEWHDVGILLVSIALRRHGWRVLFLGQNVPADQLVEQIRTLRPAVVCLSATTRESISALAQVYAAVNEQSPPLPVLYFGGRAFNMHPELRADFPKATVVSSARELIAHLEAAPP